MLKKKLKKKDKRTKEQKKPSGEVLGQRRICIRMADALNTRHTRAQKKNFQTNVLIRTRKKK